MDHEVVPYYDWPLNSSQDHFNFHQEKIKCKSEHGTWGPQKAYFKACIIHCYGPTSFAMGEEK